MHRVIAVACALATLSTAVMAQPENPGPRQLRGRALEAMIEGSGQASIQKFAEEHLAPEYRNSFAPGGLVAHLERIRAACRSFGGVLAEPADGGGTRLTFMADAGARSVVFQLEEDAPHRIVTLELETTPPAMKKGVEVAPITWEGLERRLDEEAAAGFSGTVLVARGGKIVHHRSYGFANRVTKTPITTETIFAIGSVPIDFTKAAILKLAEAGKLRTTDPITKFLDDVPADKRTITLDHLMTGGSGLPDFHHVTEVDADKDLSWIDRPSAIRRILAKELLFAPGTGEAHSHSAWVLLAAIVEIVSRQSYGDYLRKNFFEPAGMTRTGNHEDAAGFPDDAFAIGYEGQAAGKVNIPKYWGKTSWLVMGSGGMQSNPMDLYRWLEAIRTAKTLGPASAAEYLIPGVFAGGDDRGFFCLYTQGGKDMMILCSNAHSGPRDRASGVAKRLVELVEEGSKP